MDFMPSQTDPCASMSLMARNKMNMDGRLPAAGSKELLLKHAGKNSVRNRTLMTTVQGVFPIIIIQEMMM